MSDTLMSDARRMLTSLADGPAHRTATLHADEANLLRSAMAELDRWRGLGDAIRQIIGEVEGWPSHGNAPLAIAATIQLLQTSIASATTPRPLSEWTEEDGNVLWWRFPIEEPPYCGSPQDLGYTVELHTHDNSNGPRIASRCSIGGWPGGHTHWTRIPEVREP